MVGHPLNRRASSGCIPHHGVAGFTLLEIVVTLVLLGLAAALVAPAFRRAPEEVNDRGRLIAAAGEAAVQRAQDLELRVEPGGAWRLVAAGDSTTISHGMLANAAPGAFRLTPLGACLVLSSPTPAPADLSSCDARLPGTPR